MEGRPPRCPEHDSVAPADRPALQRSLRLLAALAEHHRGVRLQVGAGWGGGWLGGARRRALPCPAPPSPALPLLPAGPGPCCRMMRDRCCAVPLPMPLCLLPSAQAGAVELESAELRFATDAAGQPTTVQVKQVCCGAWRGRWMLLCVNGGLGGGLMHMHGGQVGSG